MINANTFMRFGELRQLKWSDVLQFKKHDGHWYVEIRVRKETAKNRKERKFFARGGDYFKRIKSYSKHTAKTDYVFCDNGTGNPINKKVYYDLWRKALALIGLEKNERKLSYYALRHFGITMRRYAGVSFEDLNCLCRSSHPRAHSDARLRHQHAGAARRALPWLQGISTLRRTCAAVRARRMRVSRWSEGSYLRSRATCERMHQLWDRMKGAPRALVAHRSLPRRVPCSGVTRASAASRSLSVRWTPPTASGTETLLCRAPIGPTTMPGMKTAACRVGFERQKNLPASRGRQNCAEEDGADPIEVAAAKGEREDRRA